MLPAVPRADVLGAASTQPGAAEIRLVSFIGLLEGVYVAGNYRTIWVVLEDI